MAAAVQNNGLQTLPNANHHIEMKPVECDGEPNTIGEKEAPTQTVEEEPTPEIDIVINNVVCSFSVRCHLNLRQIALHGTNVEYRRENGVSQLTV